MRSGRCVRSWTGRAWARSAQHGDAQFGRAHRGGRARCDAHGGGEGKVVSSESDTVSGPRGDAAATHLTGSRRATGGRTEEEAAEYIASMEREGKLVEECWS